ncbi:MAG: T9SS type A sorting domain-containing protein [Chitinivibrionales bacterium]|nr:T9SS type A sorting domain-containing protein [Chitinivibrionales bacterium]
MITIQKWLKCFSIVGVVLCYAGVAFGQQSVIDDLEGGTNQNKFLQYWYYYDDCEDGGDSKITNAANFDPTICGAGKYEFAPTETEGYNGTNGAKIEYEMGTTEPTCGPACTYGNMVGMGTMLAAEGDVLDITGAETITFMAKASAPMTVIVEVASASVLDFAYHYSEFDIGTTWEEYTIDLTDQGITFRQYDWTQDPVDFDPATVEKIQWKISMDYQTNPTTGSLIVDDVIVDGYEFKSPLVCWDCLESAGSWGATVDGFTLSDFDGKTPNKNSVGYYWYCYNDAEGRAVSDATEYSNIFGGVTPNDTDPTKPIILIDGNGQVGDGAYVEFELGPSYDQNGQTIKPFVGIGTMLADNLLTSFYNAEAAGADGIYFDYKTSGDVDNIRFEIKANKDYGNEGIVHQTLLPGTDGAWQGARVLWDDLYLPAWDDVALLPDKSLKISELEKAQWAFQGSPNASGSIAVDNVGFIGASDVGVVNFAKSTHKQGLTIDHTRNELRFEMPAGAKAAHVELISAQGRRVAQAGNGSFSIPLGLVSSGMYVLRVQSDNNVKTVPLSIIK